MKNGNWNAKRRRALVVLATAALLVAGGFTPISAEVPIGPGTSAITQLELDEIRATEKQEVFTSFLAEVLDHHQAHVVDHAWRDDHGFVVVSAQAVEEVEGLAESREVKIVVETAHPDALRFDQRSDVERAVLTLLSDVPSTSLAARYEPATHSVIVTVWAVEHEVAAERVDAALAGDHGIGQMGLTIEVEYEEAQDGPRAASDTEGGLAYGSCTGGFIGTKGTAYGILTAAHCTTKPSTYDGDTTGATYVASHSYDVRFTTLTGGTPVNRFYMGSAYRTITSLGIVTPGILLYKYGKNTGYGSTSVESYAGCVYYGNVNKTYCGLHYTTSNIITNGDSGGPWFVANAGYAFSSGFNQGGTYISAISWASAISGVSVKVS
nr:hypothetical protein [Actinomycetales bacterium]